MGWPIRWPCWPWPVATPPAGCGADPQNYYPPRALIFAQKSLLAPICNTLKQLTFSVNTANTVNMVQPTPYAPTYSFTDHASGSPSAQPPGVPLDIEFDNIASTVQQIINNLSLIQRDDTTLRSNSVGVNQLDGAALALITAGTFGVKGVWQTGQSYALGDFVAVDDLIYVVVIPHLSTVFATDLGANKLVRAFNPPTVLPPVIIPSTAFATLVELKAADPVLLSYSLTGGSNPGVFFYETANAPYIADDVNVIKLDNTALSVGALVRQTVSPGAFGADLVVTDTAAAARMKLGFAAFGETLVANATAADARTDLGVNSAAEMAASGGSGLSGHKNTGTGAIDTTIQKKLREEASLWDVIPDALRAAIEAGTSTTDVISYINQALLNYKRVIVRNGVYRLSTPALLAFSGQRLEFEDDAWFHPLNATTNGIAVPHNLLDCALINPGLIGETTASNGATGIFWNTNAAGTAAFGSATSDDMGGLIQDSRFKQASGTKGWNNFIHMNMAGSVEVIRSKGRGLIGTVSGQGYGIIFSGTDVTVRDVDYDSVVANQGRHGIYLGDRCQSADIAGFRLRNFRKSGLSANAGETAINQYIRISHGYLENTAADVDSSATNGAIEMSYQGAATSGGIVVNITDVQINGTGAMGSYFKGYADLTLQNVTFNNWGAAAGGNYSAVKLEKCDRASLLNVKSRTAAVNNGGFLIQHVFVQESSDVRILGGGAYNTGSGAQAAALQLNATGAGTPNAIIDRFVASKGTGSWSVAPFVNPTQNGSTIVFAKQGSQVVNTQTGADITLDASDGQSVFVLDAGATSVLQILPAGVGQIVTLRMTGATQIKQNNIYSPSVFNATSFDTNQLVCMTANGASSLWAEVARSVN